ncbi:MAG: YybH family protein [Bacillota bacterium]
MKLRSVLLLSLLLAPAAGAATSADADIDRANQDWAAAVVKGDAKLEAEGYAPDAVFCDTRGTCTAGHDAIEKMMRDRLAKGGPAKSAYARSVQRVEDRGLVYEWGEASLTPAMGPVRAGRYLTVWQRQPDGRWRILRNLVLP